ncbi:hypothetical protein EX30DRAFT_366325 [Ascodesmis nigricans]|uniref:Uncharacterized protein n=1 Tax=Ascodesmis nigricans TaxID=341454 RepID=A0A4S2MRP1_9PEZI|nr:hypothetical protein EX30DRAFT_366325 [Ascodesmis nigricans]
MAHPPRNNANHNHRGYRFRHANHYHPPDHYSPPRLQHPPNTVPVLLLPPQPPRFNCNQHDNHSTRPMTFGNPPYAPLPPPPPPPPFRSPGFAPPPQHRAPAPQQQQHQNLPYRDVRAVEHGSTRIPANTSQQGTQSLAEMRKKLEDQMKQRALERNAKIKKEEEPENKRMVREGEPMFIDLTGGPMSETEEEGTGGPAKDVQTSQHTGAKGGSEMGQKKGEEGQTTQKHPLPPRPFLHPQRSAHLMEKAVPLTNTPQSPPTTEYPNVLAGTLNSDKTQALTNPIPTSTSPTAKDSNITTTTLPLSPPPPYLLSKPASLPSPTPHQVPAPIPPTVRTASPEPSSQHILETHLINLSLLTTGVIAELESKLLTSSTHSAALETHNTELQSRLEALKTLSQTQSQEIQDLQRKVAEKERELKKGAEWFMKHHHCFLTATGGAGVDLAKAVQAVQEGMVSVNPTAAAPGVEGDGGKRMLMWPPWGAVPGRSATPGLDSSNAGGLGSGPMNIQQEVDAMDLDEGGEVRLDQRLLEDCRKIVEMRERRKRLREN